MPDVPPRAWRRQAVKWILILAVLVQGLVPVLIYFIRNRAMFFPATAPPVAEGLAQFRQAEAQLVHVVRADGRQLAAYDVVPRGTGSRASDRPTLLVLHGNADSVVGRVPWMDALCAGTRERVFVLEYSGFAGNPGRPSAEDIEQDALAAFDHLVRAGTPAGQIVLYGESIGGAAAIYVATQRQPGGLMTQSTFASVASMARRQFGWLPLLPVLVRGELNNEQRAPSVRCPWWLIHGEADRIVPIEEGEALLRAAPEAEMHRMPRTGHNDVFLMGRPRLFDEIGDRIRAWTRG